MAEWLKKQAEREAEKEQRRLERLHRKLAEPKHHFSDPEYQQQCHDLSERLEDSVLKGLQTSSSCQVTVSEVTTPKRHNSDQSEQPRKKKMAPGFWTGLGGLNELGSEEEDEEEDVDCPSTSLPNSRRPAVTMTTPRKEAGHKIISSSSSAGPEPGPSAGPEPGPSAGPEPGPSAGPEPGPTAGPEPGPSAGPEPGPSAGPEPGPSAGPEPGPSAGPDPGPSAGPEPGPSAGPEPGPTAGPEPGPSAGSEPGPSAGPEPGPSELSSQLDLSSVSSVQQLEALGLDVLKEELLSRGLKCGGTLKERAARLFSIRGLTPDQIDPLLLAKLTKAKK